MIVDDSSTMRAILKMILSKLGAKQLRLCSDGTEAFESFRKNAADIVITDWVMENMSGIELVKRLRDPKKSPHASVPIIMVTSNAAREEVMEALEVGIDNYLTKPVTPEAVYDRISQVIEERITE